MTPGIVAPLVAIAVAMAVLWRWYRSKMAELQPDQRARPLPGARLTAEQLRRLSAPPWRVVPEVGGRLGQVDHVVIGPTGVIAIETIVVDRPAPDVATAAAGVGAAGSTSTPTTTSSSSSSAPHAAPVDPVDARRSRTAAGALARAGVDEVSARHGVRCELLAKVYWGAPQPDRPAVEPVADGVVAVEGQRLVEWLVGRPPGPLSAGLVDDVWRSMLVEIGRPDPGPSSARRTATDPASLPAPAQP